MRLHVLRLRYLLRKQRRQLLRHHPFDFGGGLQLAVAEKRSSIGAVRVRHHYQPRILSNRDYLPQDAVRRCSMHVFKPRGRRILGVYTDKRRRIDRADVTMNGL